MIAVRERKDFAQVASVPQGILAATGGDSEIWPGNGIRPAALPRPEALVALRHCDLAQRFHGWRGRSGRRYICSVFATAQEAFSFQDAIVIAVTRDVAGARHALAAICSSDLALADITRISQRPGVSEWHVHLMAGRGDVAREVVEDLTT